MRVAREAVIPPQTRMYVLLNSWTTGRFRLEASSHIKLFNASCRIRDYSTYGKSHVSGDCLHFIEQVSTFSKTCGFGALYHTASVHRQYERCLEIFRHNRG